VLRIRGAAAVAEYEKLPTGIERGPDRRRRLDDALLHRLAHALMERDRLIEQRLNDCGIAHGSARVHQSFRARSRVASMFATNCSCDT
jgi:hypothetical protein